MLPDVSLVCRVVSPSCGHDAKKRARFSNSPHRAPQHRAGGPLPPPSRYMPPLPPHSQQIQGQGAEGRQARYSLPTAPVYRLPVASRGCKHSVLMFSITPNSKRAVSEIGGGWVTSGG